MIGRRMRWAAGGLTAALVAGVGGWLWPADGPTARPVTRDEAGRLALARFTTYEASPARVRVTVPGRNGDTVVDGAVDYRSHHAVGSYRAPGTDSGLLAWDQEGLGVAPGASDLSAAATMPRAAWSPRAFSSDPFDVGLQLVMRLAADRPDNAQLLAEQGPRWLRSERIDARSYDVFSGPRPRSAAEPGDSPLTYWIDGDGGLRRVTVRVTGLERPVTVDFTGGRAEAVPATPWTVG
ncbi:hypothetical protein OHV05_12055 [Kitasatospora sp. NBC_00070]|uniref:hypothetical protein n=1 Tax=Kitasatospora sp. NBC_00070 TaxID=2975962 RepID=UPI00324AA9F5